MDMRYWPLLLLVFGCVALMGADRAASPTAPGSTAPSASPSQVPPKVWVVPLEGTIGPAQASWIKRKIQQAAQENAQALLLRLDTPGGLVKSMRTIVKAILDSRVPVIGWVGPSGARAASAGTYILYACHVAAMAPGTNLGAATPIQMGGGAPGSPPSQPSKKPPSEKKQDKPADQEGQDKGKPTDSRQLSAKKRKLINDAVAYIQSLADLRGRNQEWAERAVREGASLPAKEAVQKHVAEFVASNIQEVIDTSHGRTVKTRRGEQTINVANAQIERLEPDWRTRILGALSNPNLAYILMLVGIYGLIFELASPGAILPGVLGAICLLLALYSFQALPINYAGLGLILLSVLLFVGEALAPSFGILGLGGFVAFILGSVFLIDSDVPAHEIAWPVIGTAAVATGVFVLIVSTMALRSHRRRSVSGAEAMIGRTGVVLEPLQPEGWVRVGGESWQAHSEEPIQQGETIEVLRIDGLTLHVKRANGR